MFLESKFYEVLVKISNMILLSIIWFIVSLPIITIIPATTALIGTIAELNNVDNRILATFISKFRATIKQSIMISIVWILLLLILFSNYFFFLHANISLVFKTVILVILNGLAIIYILSSIYIIPCILYFKGNFLLKIKYSLLIAIKNKRKIPFVIIFAVICYTLFIYLPISLMLLSSFMIKIYLMVLGDSLKKLQNNNQSPIFN